MSHLSRLSVPAYAVCLWLIAFPMLDALFLALPLAPSRSEWRYTLAFIATQHMLAPILGVFFALTLGAAFEQPRVLKGVAVVSGLAAVGLTILIAAFAGDSLTLRGAESQPGVPPFTLRWAAIAIKLVFALAIAGSLLLAARSLARGPEKPGVVSGRA